MWGDALIGGLEEGAVLDVQHLVVPPLRLRRLGAAAAGPVGWDSGRAFYIGRNVKTPAGKTAAG